MIIQNHDEQNRMKENLIKQQSMISTHYPMNMNNGFQQTTSYQQHSVKVFVWIIIVNYFKSSYHHLIFIVHLNHRYHSVKILLLYLYQKLININLKHRLVNIHFYFTQFNSFFLKLQFTIIRTIYYNNIILKHILWDPHLVILCYHRQMVIEKIKILIHHFLKII
jgi:hypothetical protein